MRTAMIRTREWKLILSETRDPELYHLPDGGPETANIAAELHTKTIRTDLTEKLRRHWSW